MYPSLAGVLNLLMILAEAVTVLSFSSLLNTFMSFLVIHVLTHIRLCIRILFLDCSCFIAYTHVAAAVQP